MADEFENAFNEVVKLGEKEPEAGFGQEPPSPPGPSPSGGAVAEQGSVQRPPEGVTESELEEVEKEGEEPPIPGATAGEPQGSPLDEAAVERLLAGLASRIPAPQAPQSQRAPMQQAPALVTPQESQFLAKFYEDWPDMAQANEIMLRVARDTIEQRIYREVAAVLRPKLEMIDALATRAQLDYFTQKVPEYDSIVTQIGPWVQQQPDYLRAAYEHVIQNGTEDQVLDLINRYKQATGATQAQQTQSPATRQATELSPAAKQAAARLAPVRSARTTPPQGAPTDFDSAFAEAIKAI